MSIRQIAKTTNCYEELISNKLKTLNIPIRSANNKNYYDNRQKKKPKCIICGKSGTTEYLNTGKFYCKRHYNQMYKYGMILKRTKFDKNEIHILNNYAIIDLYDLKNVKKGECFIDIEDIDKVKKYKWKLDRQGYVITETKNKKRLSMHRYLMKPKKNQLIDHINLNKNDNRKNNLRIVNKSQNEMNKLLRSDNSSGVRGVYEDKDRNKWIAEMKLKGKRVLYKRCNSFNEAVKLRKKAEIKYFGEYRCKYTN